MAKIGYARVSTVDGRQTTDLQMDALRAAGCDRIFEDQASGARTDRVGLAAALDYVRDGDTLIVWRLDRLGRSLPHLLQVVGDLETRGVAFQSLTEAMDTSTPGGRLIFAVFGALAEFERALTVERVTAGLRSARARGRVGGRPRALTDTQVRQVRALKAAGESANAIATTLGASRATIYRALQSADA